MPSEIKNPWKKTSSKQIYDNPWISVKEDQVITPGGAEGIYGTVHFKNLAIGIIPIDADGNTWLVGQYRYPLDVYSWEIPMGGGPLGVDPIISAQRELKEETGLVAENWEEFMTIHTSNSVSDETGYVFLAKDLTIGEMEPEECEELEVKKLPLKEAIEMAYNGEITDSLSLAALLKIGIVTK
ncbi:MAG: NUDIX domain-containing protein [Cyclobacteriaceae bacterium]